MTDFKLYDKQLEVATEIIEKMNHVGGRANGHMYLSGEMGTGKTYMGSYIANHFKNEGYKVIAIVPRKVVRKWNSLLDDATRLKRNDEYLNSDITLLSFEELNVWTKNQKLSYFSEKTLLLIDEVHMAERSKMDAFQRLLNENTGLLKDVDELKGLYLTGTIMEGERSKVAQILETTHAHLAASVDVGQVLYNNFPRFIFDIWSHISVAASMEDIQDLSNNREEVRQDLAPIDYISLTTEQELFTQILDAQLESLVSSMRDSSKRQERIDSIKSSYIDNPNKELIYETRTRASVNRLKNGNISHLALPLKEMDIRNTSKYIKLMDIIKNSGDEKILIYANEYDLINNLKEALVLDGIKAFTIEGVNEEEYSSYINSAFQNHKVGIVDPLKVNVGIDIHAEQLVWYQFMEQIDKMIQAQRRICRLSSKGTSLVTLLVYDTPYEVVRANDLSNATKNNAITYGVKQTDALAQLTGILLEGVN